MIQMSGKNKRNKGGFFIWTGVLLIVAALLLTGYNVWTDRRAGEASEEILTLMKEQMDEDAAPSADTDEDSGDSGALPEEEVKMEDLPLYERYPDMEMPTMEIDGQKYIGYLSIPVLGLELPVMESWDYPRLRIAPCRVKGSVYSGDIIIAAHNYDRHFGRLKNLSPGDEVIFTDAEGNVFPHEVSTLEDLPGTAVEEMESGDWDMTLFTCTIGGKSRVTVRCERTE